MWNDGEEEDIWEGGRERGREGGREDGGREEALSANYFISISVHLKLYVLLSLF